MLPNAFLILDDGTMWPGRHFGAKPPKATELEGNAAGRSFDGEVIFNTGMTGYNEILTDPSYTGQIVLMTYPHIGNYGNLPDWSEARLAGEDRQNREISARGLVVRSVYTGPVPPGRLSISDFLLRHKVCGMSEVDTRALTLHLRDKGSCNGIMVSSDSTLGGIGDADRRRAAGFLERMPSMAGRDLTRAAGLKDARTLNPAGSPHVAVLDCGVKKSIVRELTERGCRVTVVPADVGPEEVRGLGPDAVLFSNGPGDPEPAEQQAALARNLIGTLPLWGICLGHQVLALAAGGRTYKMTFGHHGVNHPVRDERTGRVFVTSQNHGFAVDESSLPEGFAVRFRNANDGSVEGIENEKLGLICVQHHPEAAPGPRDSAWIFDSFLRTLEK